MSGQEDRSPPAVSSLSPVTDPEKALLRSENHQDSSPDQVAFGKDHDYGEKPEESDLEAQEESGVEELASDEQDRDVALSGGIGRSLSILSRVRSKPDSVNNIKSIPNGGLRAWLQVAGAWVLFLNTWWVPSLS
jgi:hypothetical protein